MSQARPLFFSAPSIKLELQRCFIVRAVFIIYILSLLEGPLRKWIAPGFSSVLIFMRDPFVIALYAYAFRHGMVWCHHISSKWLKFAVFTGIFGLLQFLIGGYDVLAWALGVRTYWLYMPLAFVVAATFHRDDILGFLKLNLWIAIPYALLVSSQYSAPPYAFVNLGIGGDDAVAVGLFDGIVRPFGLFTYTGQNVQFTSSMVAILVASFLAGVGGRPPWPIFFLSILSTASMSVLTGSREIFFSVGFIILFTAISLVYATPSQKSVLRVFSISLGVILAAALFVQVFPDMLAAMEIRFESSEASEGSIWSRVFSVVLHPIYAIVNAPLFGYGIGAGAPGVSRFIGLQSLVYGESDLERNINELGLFLGFLMVWFRFAMAFWLCRRAICLARIGQPMALPLAAFAALPLAVGQITHSPLSAFQIWLFAGLICALPVSKARIVNNSLSSQL
jgi:hypothetical protein